ncbi:hypothetical protein [Pandoraea apista]|uniref:hypothetical protein n=1 Tax=Pandoraea apista TaxID=93218 RepID=UPI0021AE271E|nr:hypothetical protein [Pandoraea apista]
MQRINTLDGNFHAGDPSAGIKGTVVTAVFMQALQDELVALVESVGVKPDPADNKQVLKAIQKLIADAVSSKADSGHVDQSFAEFKKQVLEAMAKLLTNEDAAQKYLPITKAADTYLAKEDAKAYLRTDAAKKTYVAIADTYDLSTRDDFGTAIQAGTANTLYTPNITKPRGVYLVRPYRYELKCVLTGSAYFMTAFGEFVTGEGSSGSINLTPDAARGPAYDQIPFVVRVTSANATFRFGLGVRGHSNGEGAVTVTAGVGGMTFSVNRIG